VLSFESERTTTVSLSCRSPIYAVESTCFKIAKIDVADIEKIVNPITGENLYVWRDAADHACIPNLPFHDEHPQASQDIATDLADAAEILTAEQFEEAKELWAVRDATRGERRQE